MKKALIVYYSLDGNTRAAAEKLAAELECDLTEIKTVKSMPKSTFAKMLVGGRQATFNNRPPIQPLDKQPEDYEAIIIGTPVWAGKCAAPVATFLSNCAVPERVIGLFTSSAGGDNERCVAGVKKKIPSIAFDCSLGDIRGKKADKNDENLAAFIENIKEYLN